MDEKEIDLKLRLIETLLVIIGILIGIQKIFPNAPSLYTSVLFFPVAILYYILVSSDSYHFKPLFYLVTLLVAIFFSASLGIVVGVTVYGDLTIRSILAILYYLVFTVVLFIVLSEKGSVRHWLKKIHITDKTPIEEFVSSDKKIAYVSLKAFSDYVLLNPLRIFYTFIALILIFFIIQITAINLPNDNIFYITFKQMAEIYSSNFFLLIVTSLNAVFAYMMVFEMKKTREFQFNPKLVLRLEPLGTNLTLIRIKNVGNGSAYDIKVNYKIKDEIEIKLDKNWVHSLLQPTEFVRLIIEEIPFVEFHKKYKLVEFNVSYYNSSKTKFEERIYLDLKELLTGMTENIWIQEITTEDDIHDVSKSIKDIKSSLSDISKNIGYIAKEDREKADKEVYEKIKPFLDRKNDLEDKKS